MTKGAHSRVGKSNRSLIIGLGGIAILVWALWPKKASAAPIGTPPQAAPGLNPPLSLGTPTDGVSLPIQAGTQNIPELPATMAPTQPELQASASFWDNLTPVAPLPSGYVNFPSGAQAAAATFAGGNTRMDSGGSYYVQWSGIVYVLGSQDSSGNWPAQAVG